MSRVFKRVIIASIFLSFHALIVVGVYFVFFRVAPTCFDAKQNQNEQGIDCGGVCTNACFVKVVAEDLRVEQVSFVLGGLVGESGQYDVVATLKNPNEVFGASAFSYVLTLKDRDGQVLVSRTGKSAILPRTEKKLMELNLETTGAPVSATLEIVEVTWERSTGYREQPKVSIYQKRYEQVTAGFGFGKAYGRLSNESPYDFRSISVYVTLYDSAGKLLALNKTRQDTIKSGESRDFELVWPTPFSGIVDRVDMEIDADVYNSENFVKQYFPGSRY